MYASIRYGVEDAVATITLNRPDIRNALAGDMVPELQNAFAAARDDPAVRVVVLTGTGDQAFCAGADLATFTDEASELERHFRRRRLADLRVAINATGKPTIARVNGHALAGGLGLAVACDLAYAADHAQFGMPEINVGVWPMMVMAVLVRSIGRKALMELMLRGERISAAEAARLGLINRALPAAELDQHVRQVAQRLATRSPLVLKLGLEAFYAMDDLPYEAALAYLQNQLALVTLSEDAKEGTRAFLEKRAPVFKGR